MEKLIKFLKTFIFSNDYHTRQLLSDLNIKDNNYKIITLLLDGVNLKIDNLGLSGNWRSFKLDQSYESCYQIAVDISGRFRYISKPFHSSSSDITIMRKISNDFIAKVCNVKEDLVL